MLKEVRLANFRVFDEQVTFRLRPITVLIGRNSAGKSSLIKFLLMLQQSLSPMESGFLASEGERVHLGAFPALRNSRSKSVSLNFSLKFETFDLPTPSERRIFEQLSKELPKRNPLDGTQSINIAFSLDSQENIHQQLATFDVNGNVRYGRRQIGKHSVQARVGDELLLAVESTNLRSAHFLSFPPRRLNTASAIESYFSDKYISSIRREIVGWRHLSAVREESQRAVVTASPPSDDVGQRGEYSMPHLQKLIAEGGKKSELVTRFADSVAGVTNVRFVSSMRGYLAHCYATNRRTNSESYLSDFGFGVSQCLPIFVAGALMNPGQLLMVEQPEAQLHTTAQIEMGSFFRDLWCEFRVPSIIETHSSQIILRLRRHVAKGELKPEEISIAYVHVSTSGAPVVTNLDIDEKGNLEKGLPMEFFGEDIKEAMKLRAGQ